MSTSGKRLSEMFADAFERQQAAWPRWGDQPENPRAVRRPRAIALPTPRNLKQKVQTLPARKLAGGGGTHLSKCSLTDFPRLPFTDGVLGVLAITIAKKSPSLPREAGGGRQSFDLARKQSAFQLVERA